MPIRVTATQIGQPENQAAFLVEQHELACLHPNGTILLEGTKKDEIRGKWIICTINTEFLVADRTAANLSTGALQTVTLVVQPTDSSYIPEAA